MKKLISLLIIAIIALISSINANAWTDRNTYNLKGSVKAVYYNGSDSEPLKFDKNGKLIIENKDLVERDKKGRITSIWNNNFFYNSKGQVIKSTDHLGTGINTESIYNSKGLLTKYILEFSDELDGSISTDITTYTYQKFDEYDNWTKRTFKTKYSDGKIETGTETRRIVYYDTKASKKSTDSKKNKSTKDSKKSKDSKKDKKSKDSTKSKVSKKAKESNSSKKTTSSKKSTSSKKK